MNNEIQKWIEEDSELSNMLVEIQKNSLAIEDQAKEAFIKVTELYNLPLMPGDKERYAEEYEKRGIFNARSVFEEHTILNFLDPEDDPRGRVLSAIFHVQKDLQVDYRYVAEKQFGKEIPKDLLIGIRGEGLKGEIVFPLLEGKTWTELGCMVCAKLVS